MSKARRKAIIKSSYYSRLYKKERKKFFNQLNPAFVSDNKLVWRKVKILFSNKGNYGANRKLIKKD